MDYDEPATKRPADSHSCEILVHLNKHLVKGCATADEHLAVGWRARQGRAPDAKLHDRIHRRNGPKSVRTNGAPPEADGVADDGHTALDAGEPESEGLTIVKTKQFAVKPMDVEEAALQMELLDHDFFLDTEDPVQVAFDVRQGSRLGMIEAAWLNRRTWTTSTTMQWTRRRYAPSSRTITLFRHGLEQALAAEPGIEVVGAAVDGIAATEQALALTPDVVLMDVRMPGRTGVEAAEQILDARPDAKIVMLTGSDDEQDLFAAVRAGAAGYLLKEVSMEEVAGAVRAAYRGEGLVAPSLVANLLREFTALSRRIEDDDASGGEPKLTDREVEVLRLVARGMSNKEIAGQLVIAENTVKNHVRNILEKLRLRSRTEAAMCAREARGPAAHVRIGTDPPRSSRPCHPRPPRQGPDPLRHPRYTRIPHERLPEASPRW